SRLPLSRFETRRVTDDIREVGQGPSYAAPLRNLDRTLGAGAEDIGSYKVEVAERQARLAHTAGLFERGARGKYLDKARPSVETIVVDKKVAAALGGQEGITAVLEALAKSVGQAKRKGRAA